MRFPAFFSASHGSLPHGRERGARDRESPRTNLQHLTKVGLVFSLPVIFFLGGSTALIIFVSCVLSAPVMNVFPNRQAVPFTSPPPSGTVLGESVVRRESRPLILRKFLESYNSPLAEHAQTLVDVADKYGLDWRLLPAIAGQESTFCRTIPEDSHNCWGWAIHERYTKMFDTWESAIETVAQGLAEEYITIGLKTPAEIMTKYCPKSAERDGSWAQAVDYFIWALENF